MAEKKPPHKVLFSSVRKNYYKALSYMLPPHIRQKMVRRRLQFDYHLENGIEFKVAQTQSELEQAFRLLHDAYVKADFMKPHPSGLRITPYHALPSTSTLIAYYKGQVIGTVTIIRDNSLGLPLESAFAIRNRYEFSRHGTKIAEISSLAIAPEFRNDSGRILFPLLKFMYEYCRDFFHIERLFIAVNPRHVPIYEDLMLFERLEDKVIDSYGFANNAPAVGLTLDLTTAHNRLLSVYGNRTAKKNLFAYFMLAKSFSQFRFPDRAYFKTSDPVMTPELLKYFFREATNVFETFSEHEQKQICSQYMAYPTYVDVLTELATFDQLSKVKIKEISYDVKCSGHIQIPGQHELHLTEVVSVSQKGFCAELKSMLSQRARVICQFRVSLFDKVTLEAVPVWDNGAGKYSFEILSHCDVWSHFLSYLESDRSKLPGLPSNSRLAHSTLVI